MNERLAAGVFAGLLCMIVVGCETTSPDASENDFSTESMPGSRESDNATKEKKTQQTIGVINGTAWYRERMAVLPNSDLRVTLARNGRFDDPFSVVADRSWAITRNQPFNFSLPYDSEFVTEGRTYRLRAQIVREGHVMWDTLAPVDVLTGDDPAVIELLMVRTR